MKLTKIMLALLPVLAADFVVAAGESAIQETTAAKDADYAVDLKEIVVRGSFAQEKGTQRITSKDIKNRVTGNGNISELLKNNLNVQLSSSNNTANTAGEIAPENVSFHGEKFYNNSWMIDGISNNDTTNPGADNGEVTADFDGSSPFDLPAGGTQSFWLNSGLVDRVDVYDSNVSAKYGQFTGGVVDAKLKDANPTNASGSIEYRTTRDNWTKYHIEEGNDFYKAESIRNQPQFTKQSLSVNVNQPLTENTALLFSYNRTTSKIPFHHSWMKKWSNQNRKSETFLIKGTHHAENGDTFNVTAMYSPHTSTYVKPNVMSGETSNKGGGFRINGEWQHLFSSGRVNSYIGYKKTWNKIDSAEANYYNWRTNNYFDWCSNSSCTFSQFGGYGKFETGNATWTAKQDYVFNPLVWGRSKHTFGLGWQADFAQAWYERGSNTYSNSNSTVSKTTSCVVGDDTCISGNQWFNRRIKYPMSNITVGNNHYAFYLQDKINWGKWEVTPGVRIDNDRFLGNTDIAPRLTASYDALGNGNSVIFGGLNRYYAANMLAYKLREATGMQIMQTRRCSTCDWIDGTSTTSSSRRYVHSKVDTPYSDEINLGFQQKWGDSVWTAKWVQRHGKKQFNRTNTTIDGVTYRTLTNEGSSRSNDFSIEARMTKPWEFKYANIDLSGGINYSKSQSSFNYYDDTVNQEERIIVDGKLRGINEKPAMDYNNPWRVMLNIHTSFPRWHLVWTQTLNYTAGYTAWTSDSYHCSSAVAACGSYVGKVTEYTKNRFKNAFTLDWHFGWSIPTYRGQKLELTADITNVLNRKIESKKSGVTNGSSTSTTTYRLGRQFWLGARYTW